VTWLPVATDGSSERDAVLGLRPETYARHRELLETAAGAVDGELLELCRLRLAQILHCREELARHTAERAAEVESWEGSDAFTGTERAALAFVEQFVLDPVLVDRERVAGLEAAFGTSGAIDFTMAIAAHESSFRLSTLLDLAPAGR
jgi:alkylhydroperoxidase family enzyme